VLWHPAADAERAAISDAAERAAVQHAREKLEVLGPRLGAPHSSAVKGEEGSGLRELRPRAGRSRWRPIYRQVGPRTFVILSVAPEAEIDSAASMRRSVALGGASRAWRLDPAVECIDNSLAIILSDRRNNMKLSDMKTSEQVLAEDLLDPEFRREWERTAIARAVALKVLAYRTEHDLSQRALARKLGMTQPQLARLEAGEHNPTIDTLARLAQTLNVEFAIDVHPRQRAPRLLSGRAQRANAIASYETDTAEVLLAAS
jgi:transcriptional regulator with XRE-family HTH domain